MEAKLKTDIRNLECFIDHGSLSHPLFKRIFRGEGRRQLRIDNSPQIDGAKEQKMKKLNLHNGREWNIMSLTPNSCMIDS
jgi:hypothetical protein